MVVKKASSEKKEKIGGSKKKDDVKKVSDKSKKIKKDKEAKTAAKIPSAKKDAKAKPKGNRMVRRFNKLRLKNKDLDGSKGIVYIGHLPKGFEEKELEKFFGQFGSIDKLRVSRSKKTGRTRGYAFMEFKDQEVAQIAVETMDKYMIFGKTIECHLMDPKLAHKDIFKNGNREWTFIPTALKFRNRKNEEIKDETEGGKKEVHRAARVGGLL